MKLAWVKSSLVSIKLIFHYFELTVEPSLSKLLFIALVFLLKTFHKVKKFFYQCHSIILIARFSSSVISWDKKFFHWQYLSIFFLKPHRLRGGFLLTIFLLLFYIFYKASKFFASIKALIFLLFSHLVRKFFIQLQIAFFDDYLFVGAHAKEKDNCNHVVIRPIIMWFITWSSMWFSI